jgi:hypothetical protein
MGLFENDYNSTPQQSTSVFDSIGNAEVSEGGVYPIEGVYPILYVDCMKIIRTRKGEDMFVAEFDILASDVEKRKKGSRMSWVANFKHDSAPGNIRAFMAAVNGVNVDEVDSKSAQIMCSDKNPCHGKLVRLEATNTLTKKGTNFTKCIFSAIGDEMQKDADKLREAAGFPPF